MLNNFKNIIKKAIKSQIKKMGYEVKNIKSICEYNKRLDNDYYRLFSLANKNNENLKIKLHFGCGCRIFKGWINMDLQYSYMTDKNVLRIYGNSYPEEMRGSKEDFYLLEVTKKKLPFPDNSVDVIFHEDFIEHLNQENQIIFLSETLRVLKPGCVHRVNTPNLIISMKKNSIFNKGIDGVYVEEWEINEHINILTPNLLNELALLVGYKKVIFNNRNNSISDLIPLEYRPTFDREENGNIFADLIK